MKILRSTHTLNPAVGGPIESVKQSSAALRARGHEVEIVSLDAPNDPWLRDSPVPVHAVGPGRGSYAYAPELTRWISERRKEYDAVIVHGLWQYVGFGTWRALHGTGTPYFVFPHGMLDPWFKRAYPLKHIKKVLYWLWGEYRVLRDAAAVLFTSEEERLLARQTFHPYRCREVVVNYGTASPGIDLGQAREEFFQSFPDLCGKRFLLFLGRLHDKKGCDLLIQAFSTIKSSVSGTESLRLVIAGPARDEAYLAQLKGLAASTPNQALITFAGMLRNGAKWGALSAADAFILPSHQENFGIAVAEAMACSTPVLISNKVNIWREIVEDGAGFAEEDNLAGTTRLIEKWARLSAAQYDEMRAKARACFARRFEIERATDSLLQVLHRSRSEK